MNQFAEAPALEPLVLPISWTCPVTGLKVPKTPEANLRWRAELLTQAETDKDLQVDLYTAASQSVLFFINAFVFTLRVFQFDKGGEKVQTEHKHLPFVTWPVQDKHILRLEYGIDNGSSLLTDKSRDMGATWDHIAVYVHRLLFRPDESHLILSRKEDAVDLLTGSPKDYPRGPLADPGTLFGKIDYIISRLPEWMLPRMNRKEMHLVNLDNKCRVDGESSNATAGSSDRRTSIFMDEMAKMKEAEAIKQSTDDVTACRFPCSTPAGPGTAYSKWRTSGQIDVYLMPWWEHPEKGYGRYTAVDEAGRYKIRSPAYDKECEKKSPKEMATEWDMDHIGSGDTIFDGSVLEQHRRMFCRPARRKTTIKFLQAMSEADICEAIEKRQISKIKLEPNGSWQIWCPLPDGRPIQTYSYTFGVDIGKGQSASNSTCSVVCDQTREKVASFASATLVPGEFAKQILAAAVWFGGKNIRPLLIWENNGDPGFYFGEAVARTYRYPRIYFDKSVGSLSQMVGKRYGWRSSPEKKAIALGLLERAYAHGKFINHDELAIAEAVTYIRYPDGSVGPAELIKESSTARKAHGDRVIADMLCVWTLDEPTSDISEEYLAPERTIGKRLENFKRERDRRISDLDAKRTFDFSGTVD